MNKLRMFRPLLTAFAALCVTSSAIAADKPSRRPNILFIFIDDMGYADLSCFGGKRVETKEIDRLAAEGIRFTSFYVNSPICSPSRTAVTTGQYPNRWGITSFLASRQEDRRRGLADWLSPQAPTLAKCLARAGYYTAHVGKWHMGGQREIGNAPAITAYGFVASITNFEGLGERVLPKFEPLPNGKPFHHGPTETNAKVGGGPIHWVERHKVSEFFVDRALAEMEIAARKGQPFYINLWPDDVHSPNQAPPGMRGDGSPAANYLGVLKELDRQLGRVFEYIRSQPELRENTIVLLASDNGHEPGLGSAGGLRGHKGILYEGGIRSPLIVWSNRIAASAAGSKNSQTVLAGMDLPPSLLAMANVSVPAGVQFDGLDMSTALTGRASPQREKPVMWLRPPDRPGPKGEWPDLAIREGDWKLLVKRNGSQPELFNIVSDPEESKNLASEHTERVRRLTRQVIAWDKSIQSQPAD